MHLHTEGQSPCAQVDCKTIAKLYSENGYNGIVCTNHFNRFLCENYYLKGSETANIEHYLNGYYTLKNECEKFGIDVFFGMELQPDCISYYLPESQSAELLIYGVNPEWVIKEKFVNKILQKRLRYVIIKQKKGIIHEENKIRKYSRSSASCRRLYANYWIRR